jgi:hypothetical protein
MTRTIPALGAFLFTFAIIAAVLFGGGSGRPVPVSSTCSDPPIVKVAACGQDASSAGEVSP